MDEAALAAAEQEWAVKLGRQDQKEAKEEAKARRLSVLASVLPPPRRYWWEMWLMPHCPRCDKDLEIRNIGRRGHFYYRHYSCGDCQYEYAKEMFDGD